MGMVKTTRVAEEFGVSGDTVREWATRGIIPFVRMTKRGARLYDLEEVRAVVAARKRGGGGAGCADGDGACAGVGSRRGGTFPRVSRLPARR